MACARFHPLNQNLLVSGTGGGELRIYNASTGRIQMRLQLTNAGACLHFLEVFGHLVSREVRFPALCVKRREGRLVLFPASASTCRFWKALSSSLGSSFCILA